MSSPILIIYAPRRRPRRFNWRVCLVIAGMALFWTGFGYGLAHADPCEARVSGYKPGATVAGTIRYVGDGDGLCVGPGPDPTTWTEIRLADFYAPELNEPGGRLAKTALAQFMGHRAVCMATRGKGGSTRSYDRLIATCTVDGRPLAELLRRAGVVEGGRGR